MGHGVAPSKYQSAEWLDREDHLEPEPSGSQG